MSNRSRRKTAIRQTVVQALDQLLPQPPREAQRVLESGRRAEAFPVPEPGTMTFSEYNKPVAAKKPAAKDILDLDKLGEQ